MKRAVLFSCALVSTLWLGWAGISGVEGVDAVSSATRGRWQEPPPPPACLPGWFQVFHATAGYGVCVPDGWTGSEPGEEWSFNDGKGRSLSFKLRPRMSSEGMILEPLVLFLKAKQVPAHAVDGTPYLWMEKKGRGANWWRAWPVLHFRFGLLMTAKCTGTEKVCTEFFRDAGAMASVIPWTGDSQLYTYDSWAKVQKGFVTVYAIPGTEAATQLEWLAEEYVKRHGAVLGVTGCEQTPVASVYVYPSKADMFKYTRSEANFALAGTSEAHVVFEGKAAAVPGGDEVARVVLHGVWGRAGNALMEQGTPLALEGTGVDYQALARAALAVKPMLLESLLLDEAWEKPDTSGERAVAAAFVLYVKESQGLEGLRQLYQSQDVVGESVKKLGRSFQELNAGFLASLGQGK